MLQRPVFWFKRNILFLNGMQTVFNKAFIIIRYKKNILHVSDVEDMCEDIDPSRLLLQQAGRGFHGNYTCQGGNSAGWGPLSEPTELLVYCK